MAIAADGMATQSAATDSFECEPLVGRADVRSAKTSVKTISSSKVMFEAKNGTLFSRLSTKSAAACGLSNATSTSVSLRVTSPGKPLISSFVSSMDRTTGSAGLLSLNVRGKRMIMALIIGLH